MSAFDENAVSYQVVLTKCDKIHPDELGSLQEEMAGKLRKHSAAHPLILPTSSVTHAGLPQLRAEIASLIELEPLGYKSHPPA
ncbi:MAG: hypothetical protein U1E87_00685 [Alphaproteobacteria bacterium]